MAERQASLGHQFATLDQQHHTNVLGMWVFLITEIMLFGNLFTGYTAYRLLYPGMFADASRHMDFALGSINTLVLLTSSLTMALAVRSAQVGSRRWLVLMLALTIVLGLVFLGIKGLEYYDHYQKHEVPGISFSYSGPYAQQAPIFFLFYFIMTGIHAIHLTIGVGLVTIFLIRSLRGRFGPLNYWPVEVMGLYWHFVDIVWVFLFPLLYLISGH